MGDRLLSYSPGIATTFALVYIFAYLFPVLLGLDRWIRLVDFFRYWPRLSGIRRKLPWAGPNFGERFSQDESYVLVFSEAPTFILLPKFKGIWIGARITLWIIWYLVVVLPFSFVEAALWYPRLIFHFMDHMAMKSESGCPPDPRPHVVFLEARTRLLLSNSGKKGGGSKKKSNYFENRDEEIRDYARTLLAAGREFGNLANFLNEHYKDDDDFPNTDRRYRDIIKPLRHEELPE